MRLGCMSPHQNHVQQIHGRIIPSPLNSEASFTRSSEWLHHHSELPKRSQEKGTSIPTKQTRSYSGQPKCNLWKKIYRNRPRVMKLPYMKGELIQNLGPIHSLQ